MKIGNLAVLSALIALGIFLFVGFTGASVMQAQDAIANAVCVMNPTAGNQVHGVITFTKQADGIKIVAQLEGLTPGEHAFHIHEFGDCSAPDGTSAGAHFNPDKKPHGGPTDAERHVGDLGKITAGADGKAHLEMLDQYISFLGAHSILGRGMIVHAQTDDFKTQPTGNAGARIACGVIGIAK
jgi:superoxide dismutase, Cu-Zn family